MPLFKPRERKHKVIARNSKVENGGNVPPEQQNGRMSSQKKKRLQKYTVYLCPAGLVLILPSLNLTIGEKAEEGRESCVG